MKKKLVTLGLAVLVAGSSAYAFGPRGGADFACGKGSHKESFLGHHKSLNGMHDFMSIVSDMKLENSQWVEIRKTMFDLKIQRLKDMQEGEGFRIKFDKNGNIDKEDFVKNRKKYSEKMINTQIKVIEDILKILSKDQKKIVTEKYSYKI